MLAAGIKAEVQRKVGFGDIPIQEDAEGEHTVDARLSTRGTVEKNGIVPVDELSGREVGDASIGWDREVIQRIWKSRRWEVVQLSGPDD